LGEGSEAEPFEQTAGVVQMIASSGGDERLRTSFLPAACRTRDVCDARVFNPGYRTGPHGFNPIAGHSKTVPMDENRLVQYRKRAGATKLW
jgi:hypothetical protein